MSCFTVQSSLSLCALQIAMFAVWEYIYVVVIAQRTRTVARILYKAEAKPRPSNYILAEIRVHGI